MVGRYSESVQLYPGGGVSVGKVGAVLSPNEGIEFVQGLHGSKRAGNHGDGAGCHERHVVRGSTKRKCIIRWTCQPQRLTLVPVLIFQLLLQLLLLLLHLQRCQFVALHSRDVIGIGVGVALGAGTTATRLMASFIFLVVECGKGQDV